MTARAAAGKRPTQPTRRTTPRSSFCPRSGRGAMPSGKSSAGASVACTDLHPEARSTNSLHRKGKIEHDGRDADSIPVSENLRKDGRISRRPAGISTLQDSPAPKPPDLVYRNPITAAAQRLRGCPSCFWSVSIAVATRIDSASTVDGSQRAPSIEAPRGRAARSVEDCWVAVPHG